jgi:capsule polysaccharide export protein KpsE/RkpR
MGPPGMPGGNSSNNQQIETTYLTQVTENQYIELDRNGDYDIIVREFDKNSALIEFTNMRSQPACENQEQYYGKCVMTIQRDETLTLNTLTVDAFDVFTVTLK